MRRLKIFARDLLVVACLADAGVCGDVYFKQRRRAFGPPVARKQEATTYAP